MSTIAVNWKHRFLVQYPEGHVSKSIYVAFPLTSLSEKFPEELQALQGDLSLAIWTTTPWTMPGNAGGRCKLRFYGAFCEFAW